MSDKTARHITELREVLAQGPPLRLTLLFGSGAKGRLRPDSDLDIAIIPANPGMTVADELALASRFGSATGREVDVVRLDRAPTIVRWEVARNHIVLGADPPKALPRFVAAAALEHADLKPLLDDARKVTDPIIVLRKLMILREHVGRARSRRPGSAAELAADTLLQDAIAMSLFVAIQEAVDIAFHIVADEAWGIPGSYAEAFRILADKGLVDRALVEPLEGCARLRNRIAHGYASVHAERLWQELPGGLSVLESFVEAVARFIDEPKL